MESDLSDFAKTKPEWVEIEAKAREILEKYVAGTDFQKLQHQLNSKCDKKRENQLLFNQDSLMYALLALATNNGAIGLMQDLLWHWVPMFLACGKHKYAMHAIKMNWLCNPAGKSDGFQGVDWLVELNNLYTKVMPVDKKCVKLLTPTKF